MINGIGYGESDVRARVGAWAELLEQTGSHVAASRFEKRTATFDELDDAIDPRALRLPAGTSYDHQTPLTWVPVWRYEKDVPYDQQAKVWCPIEAVATHAYDLGPGVTPMFQPISNGNGAGDTLDRALVHGLLELVQRDGNSAGYRAVDRHVRVELDDVRTPETRELLQRLDDAGIEVIVKLSDTNLGMTNLYVVGHERVPSNAPHPIVLTGCGEAAHPDREAALSKALLEFCASRVRKLFTHGPIGMMEHLFPDGYLDRFRQNPATVEESRSFDDVRRLAHMSYDETMDLMGRDVFVVEETTKFSELPTVDPAAVGTIPKLLDVVADRFAAEGLPIYWAAYDVTPSTASCKAIVPQMEVETMTYYRVGRRNLDRLLSRGFDFVGYGPPPAGADRVLLEGGGEAWMDRDKVDRQVGEHYCLYREPEIHAIALL
jgi:ribosomal protein S12 methylthiotransferase accessory factor